MCLERSLNVPVATIAISSVGDGQAEAEGREQEKSCRNRRH